jgi:hypothetical protein
MLIRTKKHRLNAISGLFLAAGGMVVLSGTASAGTPRRWPPDRVATSPASALPLSFVNRREGS